MNPSAPPQVPQWSTRQVVTATLLVVSILVLFGLIYRFNNVIFLFFIAIVLSTAIRPAVKWLSRHGLPRRAGVILIYIVGFALLAGLLVAVAPLLIDQLTEISAELPTNYTNFRSDLSISSSRILRELAHQLPRELSLTPTLTGSDPGEIDLPADDEVTPSLPIFNLAARSVLVLTALFLLGFYWTLDSERIIRSGLFWLPKGRREPIREFISEVEEKVGKFLLAQGILCLTIAVLALIAYLLIGVPYALLLALVAGIFEAVPVIGPVLGAIPALLVVLSIDPTKALWVIVATIVIQGLENYVLVPRVMKQSLGVNTLVILLTLAAFTSLFGLQGALLAIPIAAVGQLFINRFVIARGEIETEQVGGRGQLYLLRYETQELAWDIRKQLRDKEKTGGLSEDVMDHLESMTNRLDHVLSLVEKRETEN